jgi:hypothetical protein
MKYLFILTLGVLCISSCTKPLVDYRSKYVGTYDVVSYHSNWVMGQGLQYDTLNYTLQVKRSAELYYVDFITEHGESTYLLEKNGALHYESQDWHYQVNGGFVDKDHFELTGGYYGLGGGNSFDATGTKR